MVNFHMMVLERKKLSACVLLAGFITICIILASQPVTAAQSCKCQSVGNRLQLVDECGQPADYYSYCTTEAENNNCTCIQYGDPGDEGGGTGGDTDLQNYWAYCGKPPLEPANTNAVWYQPGAVTQANGDPLVNSTSICKPSINAKNVTWYCALNQSAEQAQWTTDLDSRTAFANACDTFNATWTGNYCCGEADEVNETYNDAEDSNNAEFGACLLGNFTPNDALLRNGSILVHGGDFNSCNATGEIMKYNSAPGQNLSINETGRGNLTTDVTWCTGKAGRYCSYRNNNWTLKEQSVEYNLRNNSAIAPDQGLSMTTACCPGLGCWNGTSCIPNQATNASADPTAGKLCIDGEWQTAIPSLSKNEQYIGYCGNETQCYVGPDPGPGNPACVNDTTWRGHGNYYCKEGSWTTRTRLTGEALMDIVNGSNGIDTERYRLKCGKHVEVVARPGNALDTHGECAFYYNNSGATGVVLGAALQQGNIQTFLNNLNTIYNNELNTSVSIDKTSCSGATDYQKCVDESQLEVFYDNATNIVLYTAQAGDLETSFWDNPVGYVIDAIQSLFDPQDEPVASLRDFDKIYLLHKPEKNFTAVQDYRYNRTSDTPKHYITISAYGFDTGPADMINDSLTAKSVYDTSTALTVESSDKDRIDDDWTFITRGRIR